MRRFAPNDIISLTAETARFDLAESFGPSLRIGWAITRDAALRDELVTAKFNTVISCSRVDETLALQVLARSARIIEARRRRLHQNLQIVADWARRSAAHVDWVRPDAGAL